MIYSVNDKITSKKPHACGGNEWQILRTGADFKIKCLKCGHIILIDYLKFQKIVKKHYPIGEYND